MSTLDTCRAVVRQWDHWWCRSAPPDVLALLRIGFGAFLLVEAATYLPVVEMLFSVNGFVFPSPLVAAPSLVHAWMIAVVYVLAACALAIGYCMRTAITVLLLLFLYYWQLSFHLFPSSYHRLFFFLLIVLFWSGADRTFSLRMRLKQGSWAAWEPVSILPQRIIAVHITAVYAIVGVQKWWLPLWEDGRVLYYSFIGRWGTPLARWFVAFGWPMGLYDALTLLTKIFETLMPFGLWIPRVRWLFFAGGCIFHVLIAVTLGIWWFVVLIPSYIVFLEPEAVHRAVRSRMRRYSLLR